MYIISKKDLKVLTSEVFGAIKHWLVLAKEQQIAENQKEVEQQCKTIHKITIRLK